VRKDLPETTDLVTDVLRRADRTGLYLAMRSITGLWAAAASSDAAH